MGLFQREPETLDGFTPKFSREFMRFGYTYRQITPHPGFGVRDDDDEPQPYDEHTITVCGNEIRSTQKYYFSNTRDIITTMINEYVSADRKTEAYQFLKDHAHELNVSNRYWAAIEHLEEIERVKKQIAELQRKVLRAGYVASINAVEVKSGKKLSVSERQLLWAEFTGGDLPFEDRS